MVSFSFFLFFFVICRFNWFNSDKPATKSVRAFTCKTLCSQITNDKLCSSQRATEFVVQKNLGLFHLNTMPNSTCNTIFKYSIKMLIQDVWISIKKCMTQNYMYFKQIQIIFTIINEIYRSCVRLIKIYW